MARAIVPMMDSLGIGASPDTGKCSDDGVQNPCYL